MGLFDEVLGAGGVDEDDVDRWFDIFGITGVESGGAWSAGAFLNENGTVLSAVGVRDFCYYLSGCSQPGLGGIGGNMLTGFDGYGTSVGLFLYKPSPVPVPAAIWLFGTALVGLVGFGKRRKAT